MNEIGAPRRTLEPAIKDVVRTNVVRADSALDKMLDRCKETDN